MLSDPDLLALFEGLLTVFCWPQIFNTILMSSL